MSRLYRVFLPYAESNRLLFLKNPFYVGYYSALFGAHFLAMVVN